jgi:hypothetical protein
MSLRPCIVHQCFDQNKVFQFMEPFFSVDIDKTQLMELWGQAAAQLGETRPKTCRCSYRVTVAEAEILVKNGIADYLITDWRYNEEKKTFFPAPNLNLVWGGKQAEDLGLIKASYAAKTPRVMTIEKANIERSLVFKGDSKKAKDIAAMEKARIEVWGELAREVIADLTTAYPDLWDCPFKGKPVCSMIDFHEPSVGRKIGPDHILLPLSGEEKEFTR